MADVIEIVCGIDKNYAPHLAVMLKSLTEHNQRHHLKVHVLHDSVPDEIRKRVEDCNKEIEINWINAANHKVLAFEGFGHISRATYLRLMMIDVLDLAIKRVLYLDVDIIINGDILSLWETPLGDKPCAAVVDAWISAEKFAKKWNLPGKGCYFNAGVMLFDLDKLRQKPYMEQAIQILAKPDNGCDWADQDALNVVFWNEWLAIDPGWNFQRGYLCKQHHDWAAISKENYQPAIVHYTENFKPWKKEEWHSCGWLYLRLLLRTPFRSQFFKSGEINFFYILKSWLKWILQPPKMFRLPRRI